MMATKKTSRILTEVHDAARGLHKAGAIDTLTMRRFDALCLPAVPHNRSARVITEISYGSWESDPTVLVYYADGHLDGFVHMNDQWKQVHPADVATKASVIGKDQFEAIWPGLELPPSLAGWEETVHLLSSPRNAERLLASIRQIKARRT